MAKCLVTCYSVVLIGCLTVYGLFSQKQKGEEQLELLDIPEDKGVLNVSSEVSS